MNNTIYSATTGMIARQKSMNITSNDLANTETAGYKSSDLVMGAFGDYITYRIDNNGMEKIGTKTYGALSESVYNDFEQGAIYSTNRTLDFALNGSGFFTLTNADGDAMLTRNGSFRIDNEGFLVNETGSFVMGQNGKINVGTETDFSVSEQGVILSDGNVMDTLLITVPEDTTNIEKLASGELSNPNGAVLEFTGKVIQGSLEHSNVNFTDEMTSMIEDSRAFQTCSQIVKMADQIMKKTVTEIGRV